MAAKGPVARRRIHRLARLALVTSLVAFVLACYGSFAAERHIAGSPLNTARPNVAPSDPTSWYGRMLVRIETAVFGDRLDRKLTALTARSRAARYTFQVVAFVLPLVLGLAAALMGGKAMGVIERDPTTHAGNFYSVFGIMIGGLAAVISGCMCLSVFAWRYAPSVYTT